MRNLDEARDDTIFEPRIVRITKTNVIELCLFDSAELSGVGVLICGAAVSAARAGETPAPQ